MIREPSLVTPIVCSVIAAIAFSLARIQGMPDGPRGFFVFVGVVFALFAFVTGGDWLISRGLHYFQSAREAYYSPRLSVMREINAMPFEKFRALNDYMPLQGLGFATSEGVRFSLRTSTINIPYHFISEYLDDCAEVYPNFIPQHGIPDGLKRDYIQAFTGLMVNQGFAEAPLGNRPAKWTRDLNYIANWLGISEA